MAKTQTLNPYVLEEFSPYSEEEYRFRLFYKNRAIIGILKASEKNYRIDFLSKNVTYRDIFVLIAKMEARIDVFYIDTSKIPKEKMRMVKNVLRDLDYVCIGNYIYRYNFYR